MIILAGEDVGLADPNAVSVVMACAQAFERIGFPEGNFPLVEACLYLATAPKSNSALNFFDVMKEVEREDAEVPNHLRDASRDGESFGHGEGYIYPHAYRDHWAAQQYLPSSLVGKLFYMPGTTGYEGKIREEVLRKRELQAAVILGEERPGDGEVLTWSAASKGRESWFKRLESGRSGLLLGDRNRILGAANIKRHDRILIPGGDDGLLLWESLRRAPEGLCACLVETAGARETLIRYAGTLGEEEQPQIAVRSPGAGAALPAPEEAEQAFGTPLFDHIIAREPWRRLQKAGAKDPGAAFREFAEGAFALLAEGGDAVVLQSPPALGERISRFVPEGEMAGKLRQAEELFFNGDPSLFWESGAPEAAFAAAGFEVSGEIIGQKEERLITAADLGLWFDGERSRWGKAIRAAIGDRDFKLLEDLMRERVAGGPLTWNWKSVLLVARKNKKK
jgi:putative ATPase